MKDAVKRTIDNIKSYFRRRKLVNNALRQWGYSLVAQEEALMKQQLPNMAFPEQVNLQPVLTSESDPALKKSLNELVLAIDQEANAPAESLVNRNNAMMDVINRRVGV